MKTKRPVHLPRLSLIVTSSFGLGFSSTKCFSSMAQYFISFGNQTKKYLPTVWESVQKRNQLKLLFISFIHICIKVEIEQ